MSVFKRGASQFNVKFKGTNELIVALQENANLDDVKQVILMNGAELQEKAMRNAPVKTGHLKRSITLSSDLADRGMSIKVRATADYASYVEWGTRYMYAQPYMRPAFKVQKRLFNKDLKRIMK